MKRIVLALVTLLCVRAAADIIHVPGQYPTIQAGIDAAGAGDIVLVAAGTYVEEINLKAGVVVRGAGMGRSIIDGNNDPGDVVRAVGNAIGPDTKLEGFTIRGAANGGGMPGGGGVFCNSGRPARNRPLPHHRQRRRRRALERQRRARAQLRHRP